MVAVYCDCLVHKVNFVAEITNLSFQCKNMTAPILRVNSEESMCVVMKSFTMEGTLTLCNSKYVSISQYNSQNVS